MFELDEMSLEYNILISIDLNDFISSFTPYSQVDPENVSNAQVSVLTHLEVYQNVPLQALAVC